MKIPNTPWEGRGVPLQMQKTEKLLVNLFVSYLVAYLLQYLNNSKIEISVKNMSNEKRWKEKNYAKINNLNRTIVQKEGI